MAGLLDTNIPFDATAFEKKYPNLTSGAYPKYMGPQLQPRGLLQTGSNSDIDKLEAEDIAAAIRQEELDKNVFNNDMKYVNSLQQFATKPNSIVEDGINKGAEIRGKVNAQNEQLGFMDKIFNNPLLQRMMERSLYAVPTMGGNFVSEQASGERGLRSMEAQEAEREITRREAMAKLKDKNKINVRMSSLKKITDEYNKSSQARVLLSKIKGILPGDAVGGVAAKTTNFIASLGAAFGANPAMTSSQKINLIRSNLIQLSNLNKSKMTTNDYKVLQTAFTEAGEFTTTPNKLMESIKSFEEQLVNNMQVNAEILRRAGIDPSPYKQLAVSSRTKSK